MAKKYAEAKTHEWRSLLESYTFMNLAKGGKDGSLIGVNTIVDLACGEGHYTRSLRNAFPRATRVVGVDIAEEMIAMAKEKEKNKPIGVKYIVQDVKEEAGAKDEERFDLATAAWLLVYCKSVAELNEMCKAVANYVKPGGRFLTIITNPQMAFDSEGTPTTVLPGETQTNVLSRYAKYGFTVTVPSETPQEGDPFTWSIKTSKGPLVIVNYYLPRGAYKESLEKAGFEKIKFHPFELDPKSEGFGKNFAISPFSHLEDADSNDKKEFYQEFLDYPPALCIECWKERREVMGKTHNAAKSSRRKERRNQQPIERRSIFQRIKYSRVQSLLYKTKLNLLNSIPTKLRADQYTRHRQESKRGWQ